MFKLGVYRADQYEQTSGFSAWLRKNRVSYQLLRTSMPPSDAEIARFEALSQQILMPSGVYRMTTPNRFRDLNQFIHGVLRKHCGQGPLDVHDWAASDCSTSAAWFQTLKEAFPQATLTASDLNLYLTEARLTDGGTYIFDARGAPLQYIRPPFVIRMSPPEPRLLLGNRLLLAGAEARLARLRENGDLNAEKMEFHGEEEELRRDPFIFRKISMIHPTAEALRHSTQAFRIQRHSVFDPLALPADVVRTMNILNVAYFDRDRLAQAARNVWQSLKPDGIWIVGRTIEENPPLHHASVMIRTPQGFQLLERHVEKSEVEDLALALRAAP
jgi:hypothetical protein